MVFFFCSGYDDVPWNNPHVVAPNLAAMADRGVVLTNHYSQSVCSPARAALLTGYYPIRMGIQVRRVQHYQVVLYLYMPNLHRFVVWFHLLMGTRLFFWYAIQEITLS